MGEALLCRCQEFDSLGGYWSTGVLMYSPAVSRAGDRSITTRGAVLSPAHDEISLSGLQICRLFSRPKFPPALVTCWGRELGFCGLAGWVYCLRQAEAV